MEDSTKLETLLEEGLMKERLEKYVEGLTLGDVKELDESDVVDCVEPKDRLFMIKFYRKVISVGKKCSIINS